MGVGKVVYRELVMNGKAVKVVGWGSHRVLEGLCWW